ncbi:hypothetical protein [Halorussus halophilus]|uniref:hypothetical protein n=1 Tax=Halorussus halophilus TaxID=2650975 RepID=UPI00130128A7|nr:hypothetical protein [Halorussus halophilus]
MKSGASDPFADDPSESDDTQSTEQDSPDQSSSSTDQQSEPEDTSSNTGQYDQPDGSSSNTDGLNRSDLPYTLRRDKVKDERENVHQLFVQDDTDENENDARRQLEDRFDDDVYKLDAREAIYLAGMQNIDDAESVLREWGYDL